ncbi:MAG: ABC transporter ATP-binding protein [Saccharofermentanales bacterium]
MNEKFGVPPDSIKEILHNLGIDPASVVSCIHTDRDGELNPADGYVFFTPDTLYVMYLPSKRPGVSGGSRGVDLLSADEFLIAGLTGVSIFPQINGGLLVLESESGDRPAAAFSNTWLKAFYKQKELLQKVIKKEELKEEDFIDNEQRQICPRCKNAFPEEGRRVCPKCLDRRSLFIRVLGYFRPYFGQFLLIMLLILCHGAVGAVLPYLSGKVLYDNILDKRSLTGPFGFLGSMEPVVALAVLAGTIFAVRLLQQLLGALQGRMVAGIAPKAALGIKTDIYRSMQRLTIGFFNQRQTGGLLTRIQSDATEVMYFFIDGLPYLLVNTVLIVVASAVMFSMNWLLALFALFFIPVLFFMSYKMIPRLWHLHGKRHRSVRNMNSAVSDNLTGARVVKAFGQESSETKRFDRINNRVRDAELDLVNYDNRFFAAYAGIETISALIIWGIGSWFVLNRTFGMTYGALIAFVGYATMLNGPLDFMSFIFRWWSMSMNCAQRVFEIIDAVPEVFEAADPVRKERFDGSIDIRNVSFSYTPNKQVLDDISFSIKAGEYFGIVGQSGAGKTTLINLISRFYDPKEGEILIDGIPIRELAFSDLRKNIAIVSQDSYIFSGTVAENIAYAKPDCDFNDIVSAATSASAHDFIMKLPHGYDTTIGHGAKDLSGGEKQRISIARAILANPKILILDEATASVDTHTEQKIQRSLDNLVKGRTTISIAHRLSTLRDADNLIVIENGKIVEQGCHEELKKKRGVYFKLLQLQTKALAIKGAEDYEQ